MTASRNKKGFSLIGILVATCLLGIVLSGTLGVTQISLKQQSQSNITFMADQIRRNLTQHIQNGSAWQNTVNDSANTNLACLQSSTSCTGMGGAFRLRDASNHIVYDPLTPSNGFTAAGSLCTTFSTGGNDACPLRMELSWQPVCSGTCVSPQVKIIGTITYAPQSPEKKIAFNSSNYGFEVMQRASPSVITCYRSYLNTPPAANVITFTAGDCGGTLPESGHVGFPTLVASGGGTFNFEVYQPGEPSGPGISFWALTGGGHTQVRVVFLKSL